MAAGHKSQIVLLLHLFGNWLSLLSLPSRDGIAFLGIFRKGYKMNKIVLNAGLAVLMAALLTVCGCGKKADATKPIPEVKAEAEKMDTTQLRSMAMTYKDAIVAKMDEVKSEGLKLKEIPVTEMMGDKAKQLKAQIDELDKTVTALKERLQVYIDELKKKGGDISGLQI
jgi:hypothetical protein